MTGNLALQATAHAKDEKSTEEFLSGKLAQVDIAKIEKELHALWQSAAGSEGEAPTHSVTRACALNLILYSEDESSERAASDLLDDITVRHPCRAILAICKKGERPSLEAWVSARCHITDAKTRKQICCEQITVRGEAVGTAELASVVLPLIVSDLPVILWWHPERLDSERLLPFMAAIDKLVVDSGCNEANLRFCNELLKIIDRKTGGTEHKLMVSDLNWRRSLPWREAVALAFDRRHSEISPDYLGGITAIEVRYGLFEDKGAIAKAGIGLINQALLIVGWLSSKLHWKLESVRTTNGADTQIFFSSAGKNVTVQLIGVPANEASTGDIGSIKINCEQPKPVRITAVQQKSMPGIGVSFCDGSGDGPPLSSMFELNEAPEGLLIDKELEGLAMETSFAPALRAVVQILEQLDQAGIRN